VGLCSSWSIEHFEYMNTGIKMFEFELLDKFDDEIGEKMMCKLLRMELPLEEQNVVTNV
jgi:hypothetical protein